MPVDRVAPALRGLGLPMKVRSTSAKASADCLAAATWAMADVRSVSRQLRAPRLAHGTSLARTLAHLCLRPPPRRPRRTAASPAPISSATAPKGARTDLSCSTSAAESTPASTGSKTESHLRNGYSGPSLAMQVPKTHQLPSRTPFWSSSVAGFLVEGLLHRLHRLHCYGTCAVAFHWRLSAAPQPPAFPALPPLGSEMPVDPSAPRSLGRKPYRKPFQGHFPHVPRPQR